MKQLTRRLWLAAFLTTASAVVDVQFLSRSTIGFGLIDKSTEDPPLHPEAHEELHAHEAHEEPHGHVAPHSHEGHAAAEHGHHEAHGGHEDHLHSHHGEGHGAEHHHHEESDPEAFGLACFLMGGVAALMMVFYLVNNKSVQGATWKVLNMTASIFVAVLIYGTIKSAVLELVEPEAHGFGEMFIILILFLVIFFTMHYILFKVKMRAEGEDEDVEGVAVLMAHVTGFASMYGFADAAELPIFEELGVWGPLVLIIIACIVLVTMNFFMDKVMDKVASADGEIDESEWKWIDLCQETDDDVFCLTMSFLITLYVRFLIRGTNKAYEPGHAGNVVQSDATILWLVAIGFVVLVLVGTVVHMKVHAWFSREHPEPDQHFRVLYPKAHRAMDVIQHCNFMTCAWCFLFWGEWQLYVLGWDSTIIGGCLVVAVVMSLSSFAAVLAMYKLVVPHIPPGYGIRKALKSFELALGILVGFSWERAFDVGFEEMELKFESMEDFKHASAVMFYILNVLLFFTVAPAWRLYIFPTAMRFEKMETKEEDAEDAEAEKENQVK